LVTKPSLLSGRRYDLAHGHYTASISSVGASLRELRFDGRDLVVPFSSELTRPFYRGAILAPWPNRVVDGQYTFSGIRQQLSITEPARGNALHGLVAWLDFALVRHDVDELVLEAIIVGQPGYPHLLDLTVSFTLDDEGLLTSVVARNCGTGPAPYGVGPHPYLVAGEGTVDDWTLDLPASKVLEVTPDRLIPQTVVDVASDPNTRFDFREPRVIGDTFIDNAYTDLNWDETGTTTLRLVAPSGTGVSMTWGRECPWVQIHTADRPAPEPGRLGLAVEPLTCPPDAFNSGIDLIVIQPGECASAGWSIGAL
jgi:aldose 1-epimerase